MAETLDTTFGPVVEGMRRGDFNHWWMAETLDTTFGPVVEGMH